ncbi:MAG: lamin tail domain-containing protein, partial [bacterium]
GDLIALPEELIAEFRFAEVIPPNDTAVLTLQQQLASGYYRLLLILPDDENLDNNQLFFEVSIGPITHEIIVTEFLAAPVDPLESEWLECRNISERSINLYGWAVGDSLRQSEIAVNTVIDRDEYFIIAQDSAAFRAFYEADCSILQPASWSNLNNDGDRIMLFDDFGVLSDSLTYADPPAENISLELNEELLASEGARRWYPSTATGGASPCSANSVSGPEVSDIQVVLLNQVFSPYLGESLRYRVSTPPATPLTIEVFDLAGRRQFTIAEERLFSTGDFEYAGESDYFDRLPVGAYILQVSSATYNERLSFAVAGSR